MTSKPFPKQARYEKIMDAVYRFFINENIMGFPIDPEKIIKRNKWGLISYSELARQNNLTISQIITSLQSKDGYVIWDGLNYTIAYNDTILSPGRIRFTLMHEIGHIYLGHLTDFEETILNRGGLNKEKYKILEREANAFARNALSPPAIAQQMKTKFKNLTIDNLISCFHVSYEAALVRLKYLPWDLAWSMKYLFFYLNRFESLIHKICYTLHCSNCDYVFVRPNANYCPICGTDQIVSSINPFLEEDKKMALYIGIELDDSHRAKECPVCENEEIIGDYCQICGTYLVNRCTGFSPSEIGQYEGPWHIEFQNSCGELLSGEARFCHKCGSTSTFFESGLLKRWENSSHQEVAASNDSYEISDEDLPF